MKGLFQLLAVLLACVSGPALAQNAQSVALTYGAQPHEPRQIIHATRFDDHSRVLIETTYEDLAPEWHLQMLQVFDGEGALVISIPYEFHPGQNPIYSTWFDIGLNRERTAPGLWKAVVALDGVEVAETTLWVVDDYRDIEWDDPTRPIWQGSPSQFRPNGLEPDERGEIAYELTLDDAGYIKDGVILSTTPSRLEQHEERMLEYEAQARDEPWFDPLLANKRIRIRNGKVVQEVAEEGAPIGALDDAMTQVVSLNRYLPTDAGRTTSTITIDITVLQRNRE